MVVASRNPLTGALSVASIPFMTVGKGRHTPAATITLDAAFEAGKVLGVFGEVATLTLRDETRGKTIYARDLANGAAHDITSACRREHAALTLPGDLLAQIGREKNPANDFSSPGVLIEVG